MVLLISTCPVGLVCHCLQAVLKPLFLSEIMYATIYAGSSLIYASLACWMRSQSRELPVWTFQNSLCSMFIPCQQCSSVVRGPLSVLSYCARAWPMLPTAAGGVRWTLDPRDSRLGAAAASNLHVLFEFGFAPAPSVVVCRRVPCR